MLSATRTTGGICGATITKWQYEILSSNAESRKIYSLRSEGDGPKLIPLVATIHTDDGLIMSSEQCGNQFDWRLLVNGTTGKIHEKIRENL
ncbi:hypothetical protein [Halorientalis marina]|uniref:hypothetical protein n=1 Tax=Halorientalis marina TaxID=2931976 RepID=UPI003FF0ABAE